jgi:Helicase associated domain
MWVHLRRQERRRGVLSGDRVKQLEQVSGWTWTGRETPWQRPLSALLRYVATYGCLPGRDVVVDGLRLSDWADRQRRAYRHGELSPERAAQLEGLPGWSWTPADCDKTGG